ncbi:MAG: T9SS type A sorting domain-containing protein [Saprospiraceae bacterium]
MKKIVHIVLLILTILPVTAQVRFATDRYAVAAAKNSGGGDNPTIKIFPNPATDYFEISQSEKVAQIVVFNLVGKELKRFDANEGQRYNIAELPKGLYLVQLLDRSGQTIVTQRVSKR